MTLEQFDALRSRWHGISAGEPMTGAHLDDVTALVLRLDLEAAQLAVAKCLLAEIAASPEPLPRGYQQRCAAFLQVYGHPDC